MSDIVARLREAHPNSAQRFAGSNILLDAADEIERLRKALAPFVKDIENWTDDHGWTDEAPSGDRIRDWFGPSDFRAARAALDAIKEG